VESPDLNEIRPIDVGRAARMALASQNHDAAAIGLVITEAQNEDAGLLRLLSALGAGYAVMAAHVAPNDPAAPLLSLIQATQTLD
jgi:hypothetical protein